MAPELLDDHNVRVVDIRAVAMNTETQNPNPDGRRKVPDRVNTVVGCVVVSAILVVAAGGIGWWLVGPSPGKRLAKGHVEVFYRDGAAEDEAAALLQYLYAAPSPSGSTIKAQLRRTQNGYAVAFVIAAGRWDDQDVEDACRQLANRIQSDVLGGANLMVTLCDERFRIKRILSK